MMNINQSNSKSTKDEIRDTGKINKISHNQKDSVNKQKLRFMVIINIFKRKGYIKN